MSYVSRTLAPQETLLVRARLHWVCWLRAWAALLILGFIAIGVVIFIADLTRLLNTEAALTNQRLILKTGWLDRHTRELELASVEAVDLDQSFWGRLLGYGRMRVHGAGGQVWTSPLIARPLDFRRETEAALAGHGRAPFTPGRAAVS